MSGFKISYLNYPIYGLASNDTYIITSGGGGGKNYGIEDLLEVNILNEKEKKLEAVWSTAEQGGVIDSIHYVRKYNIWIGSIKNECILFEINEETGPHILLRFVTDFSEKNPRQVVAKFANTEDFILTGGDDKTLRLWKLKFNKEGNGIPINGKAFSQSGKKEQHKGSKNSDFCLDDTNKNKNVDIRFINPKDAVEHLGDFVGHDESIKDCDITTDDKLICTCSSDCSLKIWDTYRFVNLCTEFMKNPKNKNDKLIFRSCKFLKKIKVSKEYHHALLTTGSSVRGSSFLIVWDLFFNEKKEKFSFTKQSIIWLDEKPCCNMTISSDEKYIAFGFSTGTLKLYNSKFMLLSHYKKQELPITAMCFAHNETILLAAGADYSIICVDIDAFTTSCLKKICRILIIIVVLIIVLIILLDFFNVGFDLYFDNSIKTFHVDKISSPSKSVHVFDEL